MIYAARANECVISNAFVSGFAFISSIVIGTASGAPAAESVVLENITAHSPAASPSTGASSRADGEVPHNAIQVRDGHRDIVLRDINLEYADSGTGQNIQLQAPTKLIDLSYHGAASDKNDPIDIRTDEQHIIRPDMTLTDGSKNSFINTRKHDDIYVERPDFTDNSGAGAHGVLMYQPGKRIDNLTVTDPITDITGSLIRINIDTEKVQMNVRGVEPSEIGGFGAFNYAGGSMLPQDVTTLDSAWLYDQRLNVNDGSTGTAGPAYYDSGNSQWVSVVDGTTFS